MLVACRLAGLSALILGQAVKVTRAQCGPTQSPIASSPSSSRPKPCASPKYTFALERAFGA